MLVRTVLTLLLGMFVLAACTPEPELDPPTGWTGEGTERWWRTDVDTSEVFRDLSGFETMGLSDREDGLREEGPIVRNVQRRFLPLYRNNPEVVDSVFGAVAVPMLEREATAGQTPEERDALVTRIHRRMHRIFYPPQPRANDRPPLAVPDSLREQGISGTVAMQITLDDGGNPVAIEKLEGVHPTMDAIVMRNFARRTWQPAHLEGEPIESWLRTNVTIGE